MKNPEEKTREEAWESVSLSDLQSAVAKFELIQEGRRHSRSHVF